ncbi:MAG: sugar ABC transporter substrate-binding protein, partial [Pseudomonadota bacterium]
MQIMGEWVKSEYLLSGLTPNRDFLCFPAPGTKGSFLFLSDFIGVFRVGQPAAKKSAEALVAVVMNQDVQEKFNLAKGSIPSRLDVSGRRF